MSDFYGEIMGQPSITRTAAAFNGNGDNTIVAAPAAGYALVLFYFHVQNESTTGTTVLVKHGSTTTARVLLQNQGDGWIRDYSECPVIMPAATALVVNLSGANAHNYTVAYTTIKVG